MILNAKQKIVYTMHTENHSRHEIAEATGLTLGSVTKYLAVARELLRDEERKKMLSSLSNGAPNVRTGAFLNGRC